MFLIYVFSDGRSFQVLKAWCWPCVQIFRLVLSSHIYCFAFWDTNLETLSPCAPYTCCGNACLGGQVSSKYGLDMVNGSFCNLCSLAPGLAFNIFATQCWWVPGRTKQLSTVAILLYRFLSCLVSQNAFQVVSVLQSIICLNLSPQYGHVMLVNGYLVLTGVNRSQHGCPISKK